jgi:hypothetical protein
MNKKEYSRLCDVVASLNIALAAMDDKINSGFRDPKKTAKEEILKAYLLVDRMLIKKSNYDHQ